MHLFLFTNSAHWVDTFLTKNGTRGWNRSSTKNAKNETERNDRSSTQNGTDRNQNGTIEKKEGDRNDLDEGPCSRTERNDLKKVGTCPALVVLNNNRNSCIKIQYSCSLHCLSCRNVTEEHHTTFCRITKQSYTLYMKYILAAITLF